MKVPFWIVPIVVVLLTALGGYHGIHVPGQRAMADVRRQITTAQQSQASQREVAKLFEQIEAYRNQLSAEPNPSWLAKQILAAAQSAGVEVTSITQQDPQSQERFTLLAVQIRLMTSYHQLGAFLDELEHSDHFIRIERIEMSKPVEYTGQANVTLVLGTLYLPSPEKLLANAS